MRGAGWQQWGGGEAGTALVEYALILAFVALVAAVALGVLGGQVSAAFQAVADGLATVAGS
jgi:Flp pilus assembly pilin Flp